MLPLCVTIGKCTNRNSNTIHNFVGLFIEDCAQAGAEGMWLQYVSLCGIADKLVDWRAKVEVEEVITRFKDFHPDILSVIRYVPLFQLNFPRYLLRLQESK